MVDLVVSTEKDVYMFFVNNTLWRRGHQKVYRKHLSKLYAASNTNELQECCIAIDIEYARRCVYRWLAMRAFLTHELEKRLLKYEIDPHVIHQVLEECSKHGYLDDHREVLRLIERYKEKGMGPHLINQRLIGKDAALKDVVYQYFSSCEQEQMINSWIIKKGNGENRFHQKFLVKLFRFLSSKGFDSSLIRKQLFVDE